MSTIAVNNIDSQHGGDILVNQNLIFKSGKGLLPNTNWIGVAGTQGFGVGICPSLPDGFVEMTGTTDPASENYGNYQYQDGSVMCWIPKFYYKIGTGSNGLGVNIIDIKSDREYSSRAAAEADGYALHRAFVDGGEVKRGFMVDKYQCSKAAWGTGQIASSIKNGNPISTEAAHNPIADLTAISTNAYFEVVTAAHARDGVDGAVNASSIFFCTTRFIYSALAILSMAHGQAASGTTYCAWYDGAATTNFPKGNNDNAFGDTNDAAVDFTSDGYGSGNSAQTGSGVPFAKTTHNGQDCGVTDLNGNMWEISLGLTRPGTTSTEAVQQTDAAAFYILKESVAAKNLLSGWDSGNNAWGGAVHLATLYDVTTIAHISNGDGYRGFGDGANQVLSEATSGAGYKLTALGIYKDANGESAAGTNLFGSDKIYEYHRSNLAVLSGGDWNSGVSAGLWAGYLNVYRSGSGDGVGFRCAAYPV